MALTLAKLITIGLLVEQSNGVIQFFTPDELRQTFGVRSLAEVPKHRLLVPRAGYADDGVTLSNLQIDLLDDDDDNGAASSSYDLSFEPSTELLATDRLAVIYRGQNGGGRLTVGERPTACHYRHMSNESYAAVSTCDGHLTGTIITPRGVYVLHPIPDRHLQRLKRSDTDRHGLHVLFKREIKAADDFCGLDRTTSIEELEEDEAGVQQDAFVFGQTLSQSGNLVIELAIFIDDMLWRHFQGKYGGGADAKLQEYALTLMNNIQIMYHQPSCVPQLTFRIVRYEVLTYQPSEMAPHLHGYGHAQQYLDKFCQYQRKLSERDWDHALLLTGHDIHRGSGSRSISGIARLDGMCDSFNTCTLAEGLDFTSAFIGTHELGHSLGMRHDEPYCPSSYIMSSSLGPGKVTWSTCSMRDYHAFLQRLDSRGNNCLRNTVKPVVKHISMSSKPGQLYDADLQCHLMHGPTFKQITPRSDYSDGICYMMWCGQSTFGRIITSHPALEGTYCGEGRWCELGRCVTGGGWRPAPVATTPEPWIAPTQPQPVRTTTTVMVTMAPAPMRVHGGWTQWTPLSCSSCYCSPLEGGIGLAKSTRTCTAPTPANGGAECSGAGSRAIICSRDCRASRTKTIQEYIDEKCSEHRRLKDDAELTGSGSQLTRFSQRACKIFCDVKSSRGSSRNYRFFGDNLHDGTVCGHNRYCFDGECLPASCDDSALITRDLSCPSEKCAAGPSVASATSKMTGQWGTWSLWTSCSVTCGHGYKQRSRTCSMPGHCIGDATESEACQDRPCPHSSYVPGVATWTEWTEWNQCSVSCGTGSQARYRKCVAGNTLSTACTGHHASSSYTQPRAAAAPVPLRQAAAPTSRQTYRYRYTVPAASSRSTWTIRRRSGRSVPVSTRTITPGAIYKKSMKSTIAAAPPSVTKLLSKLKKVAPAKVTAIGAKLKKARRFLVAVGVPQRKLRDSMEIRSCDAGPCHLTGVWGNWAAWTSCSKTCGPGMQTRTRQCQTEPCDGPWTERMSCNERHCSTGSDTSSMWNVWGAWSGCSRQCGGGTRSRIRNCYGSSCIGTTTEQQSCNEEACAGATSLWSQWASWGLCSVSCGPGGVQRRTRTCLSGNCPGELRETASCPQPACSAGSSQWGGWGYWSGCSEPCGNGVRKRVRKCYGTFGGCDGNEYEKENCYVRPCRQRV